MPHSAVVELIASWSSKIKRLKTKVI